MKTSLSVNAFPLAAASLTLCGLPGFADTVKPAWAVVPSGTNVSTLALPAGLTAANTYADYSWYGANNNVRGVAANPVNGNVLVSDTSQNVRVLNSSGVYLHTLSKTGLASSGATLNMVQVGVADDGVVYASNLVLNTSPSPLNNFKIWRWQDDSNPAPDPLPDPFTPVAPTLAWPVLPAPTEQDPFPVLPPGDPAGGTNNQRWGDTMDVRGGGSNTKLVFGARNNPVLAIFTTTDGLTFAPHVVTFAGGAILGVAFGPDIPGYDDPATAGTVENLTLMSVFVKLTGTAMRRVNIRTDTWTATSVVVYDGVGGNPPVINSAITAIGSDPRQRYLAGVSALPVSASATVRANAYGYEFGSGILPNLIAPDSPNATQFFTGNANGNGIAAADVFTSAPGQTPGLNGIPLRSRFYLMSVANSIIAYDVIPVQLPPNVVTPPASATVIAGWKANFSVAAAGTLPLTYQWIRNDVEIPGATSPSYVVDPVSAADNNAVFKVRVTNPVSTVTSTAATLSVQPRVDTAVMTPGYKLPVDTPGRPYLTSSDTQRGVAWNPVNDHLLIVNRSGVQGLPNPSVVILDAATGNEVLDTGVVRTLQLQDPDDGLDGGPNDVIKNSGAANGGFFALNSIDIDDAGVVYACNLAVVGSTAQFKIYRWANDNVESTPVAVYGPGDLFDTGSGGDRAGEHIKVRGSGLNTQILVGARNEEKFAIFTAADDGNGGLTFTPTVFSVPDARPAGATVGSGAFFACDFGAGNTIWAKTYLGRLLQVSFDVGTGVAQIAQTITTANIPSGVGPIAVDPVKQILGGIHNQDTPNNLRLYNYNRIGQVGGLLDQEFFLSDNLNGNYVGAVDIGGNRIYALDTNNGLVVMNITYTPVLEPAVLDTLEYSAAPGGDTFRFTLKGTTGTTYKIEGSPSMSATTWSDLQTITLTSPSQVVSVSIPLGQTRYYFRARTQ
jgi:hypothetical protein